MTNTTSSIIKKCKRRRFCERSCLSQKRQNPYFIFWPLFDFIAVHPILARPFALSEGCSFSTPSWQRRLVAHFCRSQSVVRRSLSTFSLSRSLYPFCCHLKAFR